VSYRGATSRLKTISSLYKIEELKNSKGGTDKKIQEKNPIFALTKGGTDKKTKHVPMQK
jgi:hypothetical protein